MGWVSKIFGIDTNTRRVVTDAKRRSGYAIEEPDRRDFNEVLFKLAFDHIIGSSAQVAANNATIYWNSANTEFRDQDEAVVTLLDGDRLLWAGLDAITADIDISTIDELEHTTDTGVTIAFGSQNVLLGSNQSGFLNCSGTGDLSATDSPEFVVNNNRTEKLTDFKTSKDLVINVQTSTTSDLDASFIRLLDDSNNGFLLEDVDETFNITTDLNAGTEKASTQYQKWIGVDYLKNVQRLLVPDLTGTADSNVVTELRDSTATFQTDAVQPGDRVYNLTDLTQGTVVSVDSETAITLSSDFFPLGTEGYKIRILTPQFDSGKVFKGRIGAAFRNSSGNFDDSTYTQIQDPKDYSEAAGDFTVTGTNSWATTLAFLNVRQINDWTGEGKWKTNFEFSGTISAATNTVLTVSGIVFKTGHATSVGQSVAVYMGEIGVANRTVQSNHTNPGTATITINSAASNFDGLAISGNTQVDSKPTFHN